MKNKEIIEKIIKNEGDCSYGDLGSEDYIYCSTCPLVGYCSGSRTNIEEQLSLAKFWLKNYLDKGIDKRVLSLEKKVDALYSEKMIYGNSACVTNEFKAGGIEFNDPLVKVLKHWKGALPPFTKAVANATKEAYEIQKRQAEAFIKLDGALKKHNDPEIIGNVMRWNGRDYLDADFVPFLVEQHFDFFGAKKWIPFKKPDGTDNIIITDELACMRKKNQPIWVMVNALILGEGFASDLPCKLFAVETNADPIQFICNSVLKNTIAAYKCRLANIDDLKKAGIR